MFVSLSVVVSLVLLLTLLLPGGASATKDVLSPVSQRERPRSPAASRRELLPSSTAAPLYYCEFSIELQFDSRHGFSEEVLSGDCTDNDLIMLGSFPDRRASTCVYRKRFQNALAYGLTKYVCDRPAIRHIYGNATQCWSSAEGKLGDGSVSGPELVDFHIDRRLAPDNNKHHGSNHGPWEPEHPFTSLGRINRILRSGGTTRAAAWSWDLSTENRKKVSSGIVGRGLETSVFSTVAKFKVGSFGPGGEQDYFYTSGPNMFVKKNGSGDPTYHRS